MTTWAWVTICVHQVAFGCSTKNDPDKLCPEWSFFLPFCLHVLLDFHYHGLLYDITSTSRRAEMRSQDVQYQHHHWQLPNCHTDAFVSGPVFISAKVRLNQAVKSKTCEFFFPASSILSHSPPIRPLVSWNRVVLHGDLLVQHSACCVEQSSVKRTVTLHCSDLSTVQHTYKHITSCGCRGIEMCITDES